MVNGNEVTNYLTDTSRPFPKLILETDTSGTPLASYTHGTGPISQVRNGVTSYYHQDATQSVRQLTDAFGVITDTYTYDAFGLQRDATGSTENVFRFVGEQQDSLTGLYFLRERYLDPRLAARGGST